MESLLKEGVERGLSNHFKQPVVVKSISTLSGGCINEAAKISTSAGDYFIKWNKKSDFPDLFKKEALGLNLIAQTKSIATPEVINAGEAGEDIFLILQLIESTPEREEFWWNFGKELAALHKNTNSCYGLDHNNYIGSLVQSNNQHQDWTEFYIVERLEPLIRQARDKKLIPNETISAFSRFFTKLDQLLPKEKPSFLHGDLWSGNYLIKDDHPVLIDPAVYYGHREVDLAMTTLFGGFDPLFYEAYEEAFPLDKGWRGRLQYHQLYPLLVHLNLFGSLYLTDIKKVLQPF